MRQEHDSECLPGEFTPTSPQSDYEVHLCLYITKRSPNNSHDRSAPPGAPCSGYTYFVDPPPEIQGWLNGFRRGLASISQRNALHHDRVRERATFLDPGTRLQVDPPSTTPAALPSMAQTQDDMAWGSGQVDPRPTVYPPPTHVPVRNLRYVHPTPHAPFSAWPQASASSPHTAYSRTAPPVLVPPGNPPAIHPFGHAADGAVRAHWSDSVARAHTDASIPNAPVYHGVAPPASHPSQTGLHPVKLDPTTAHFHEIWYDIASPAASRGIPSGPSDPTLVLQEADRTQSAQMSTPQLLHATQVQQGMDRPPPPASSQPPTKKRTRGQSSAGEGDAHDGNPAVAPRKKPRGGNSSGAGPRRRPSAPRKKDPPRDGPVFRYEDGRSAGRAPESVGQASSTGASSSASAVMRAGAHSTS